LKNSTLEIVPSGSVATAFIVIEAGATYEEPSTGEEMLTVGD